MGLVSSWLDWAWPPSITHDFLSLHHFRSAIWQAWQDKVATDLCKRKECRGEFCFDIYGSHQLLVSHLRDRDKMLSSHSFWWGLDWFLLSETENEDVKCWFCNAPDNDGHLLGGVLLFTPLLKFSAAPSLLS